MRSSPSYSRIQEIAWIHDLVVHDYGPGRRMISCRGNPVTAIFFEIHDVIDRIEKELKRKLGCEAVIHMDPIVVNDEKINETKKRGRGDDPGKFPGCHDPRFRMVQGPTHTNLIFDAAVPFQYGKTEGSKERDREADHRVEQLLCGDPGGAVVYGIGKK